MSLRARALTVIALLALGLPSLGDGGGITIGHHVLLITSDRPSAVERRATGILADRLLQRGGIRADVMTSTQYSPSLRSGEPGAFPVFVGIAKSHALAADVLSKSGVQPTSKDEGYTLVVSQPKPTLSDVLPAGCSGYAVVCGADARGVLYGVGRLLRAIDYGTEPTVRSIVESTSPAVGVRAVYLAPHFRNFYECAPISEVQTYIEDCALWGSNAFYSLMGIGGYPADAGKDPNSYIGKMSARIRKMNETARSLGMKVGFIGEANEGWVFRPELRATPSPKPLRPYGTICASKPDGLKMILDYRRAVLDLIGPIDEYCIWPYDSGGCGCSACSDEHGWTKMLLKIAPQISAVVKEKNPNAKVLLATWLMDDAERKLVYDQCDGNADWFDGLVMETQVAGEHKVPGRYSLAVFPEISMFRCYFTSYGCNGANPAPAQFVEEARRTVSLKHGAILYSEGIYDDFNKIVWLASLWDPTRTAEDIAAEYSGYYFGPANRKTGTDLITGLEGTWGSARLSVAKPETVSHLLALAESMRPGVPSRDWCKGRWLMLLYRARMDDLMVKVGPDRDIYHQAAVLFYEIRGAGIPSELRGHIRAFRDKLKERQKNLDTLFSTGWEYLKQFHSQSTNLVFRPDELTGNVDYRRLLDASEEALKSRDDTSMREAMFRGFQRFYWSNNVPPGYF